MKIHERAIVHPKAQVGKGTVIGPDVIIDEHCSIGENCEVRARAVITGFTKIGNNNQIGYGAIIGAEPQDLAFEGCKSFVEIGDGNMIREYVTIHRGTKEGTTTRIGNKTMLMAASHVAHNCIIEDGVILVNNVLLGGYVEVHRRAFLGGASVVHQFTRIGSLAMVRGQTRLGMDVPPYCMAVATNAVHGLNRVGMKRGGFSGDVRRNLIQLYDQFYHSGMNREQALQAIKNDPLFHFEEAKHFCEFITSTQRGLCRSVKGEAIPVE